MEQEEKMKPINVFNFVNNKQQEIYKLVENKASLHLIRKEELRLQGMDDLYGLLNEWLKYLKNSEKVTDIKAYYLINEIINS